MTEKLPFSRQDYFKLLDSKLAPPTPVSGSPLFARLKQAGLRIKTKTVK